MSGAGAGVLKRVLLRMVPEPFLAPIRKRHYLRVLRAGAPASEHDVTLLPHFARAGDCVLDVGANIGVYTAALSRLVGASGRVLGVEPVPHTRDILEHNVRGLGLANVQVLPYAVSDVPATVTMQVPRYPWGGDNLYEARIVGVAGDGVQGITVEARPIDALVAGEARPVTFVKMDVEGHERACLRGARRLLEVLRPVWLVEIQGDPDETGSDAADVFATFAAAGYVAFWYDGARLRRRAIGELSPGQNYFFVPGGHAAVFGAAPTLPVAP